MTRNLDLIRDILLQMEEHPASPGWIDIDLPEHSPVDVAYHVYLLKDAGFITAIDVSSTGGIDFKPQMITHRGQEYLASIRDQSVWTTFKSKYGEKVASMTLPIIIEKSAEIIKATF